MRHLVIGQRQKAPNFSAFHWSPHGCLITIGQHFVTTRVVHLPKRTETSLITESDQSRANHQLLQLCTARTAWSDSDQAVQAVHSCKSWFWSESWFVVCMIRICDLCFLETPFRSKGLAAVLRFSTFYVEKVIKQLYFSKISCYNIYSTILNHYLTGYCKLSKSPTLVSQSTFLHQSIKFGHLLTAFITNY